MSWHPRAEPDHVAHVTVGAHAGEPVGLHARRWDGDRQPIVLVHGLASNARLWDGVAPRLAEAGHAVVAIDQRGHGRSDKPGGGYDMATVVDDLATLIDAVGFERPVVVGQSWGGNVVVELGAAHPGVASAIVGVDGGTIELRRRFPDWESCRDVLAPPHLVGTPAAQLEAMLRRANPDWPETGIQGAMACFEVRADGTIAPWLDFDRHLAVLRGLWDHEPSRRYEHIEAPVLLLAADDRPDDPSWRRSKAHGLQEAAAALARARVEWLVGHHDLHAQHPDRVAALIREVADAP